MPLECRDKMMGLDEAYPKAHVLIPTLGCRCFNSDSVWVRGLAIGVGFS